MEIDLVYVWADGNDAGWRAKKNAYLNREQTDIETNCEGRNANIDELKFSLRSVEKYAGWVRKIFIVTDGQTPAWLNLQNSKIQLVDITDILPEKALPCYNSVIIEHFLYKINGLSEYFLYANDDMFFNAGISPDFFFAKDGFPIVRLERKPFAKSRYAFKQLINKPLYTYRETILNAAYLVEKRFGTFYSGLPHHNIDAYRKSDYKDVVEKGFTDEIAQTIENHIRSPKDIQRIIYLYYALAVKHGHLKYVDRKESCVIGVRKPDYERYFKRYNPKLFCMNDGPSETESDRIRAKAFLEQHFPLKSSFEK